jgi:hypothetical protein
MGWHVLHVLCVAERLCLMEQYWGCDMPRSLCMPCTVVAVFCTQQEHSICVSLSCCKHLCFESSVTGGTDDMMMIADLKPVSKTLEASAVLYLPLRELIVCWHSSVACQTQRHAADSLSSLIPTYLFTAAPPFPCSLISS